MPPVAKNPVFPVFALLYSASMWGIVWYPLRLLEQAGLHGLWSTLIIYLGATAAGLVLMRGHWAILSRQPGLLILLGLTNGWCNATFILAVLDGNVFRVLLLFYLSPIWTVLLGRMFLQERMSWQARLTLVIAMIGAVVMLWDPRIGMPWPQSESDWLALSSGFAFAASNVLVRRAAEVPVEVKTFGAWVGVVIFAGVWMLMSHVPMTQASYDVLVYCFLLGLVGFSTMTFAVQYGVTHMPVHRSATILLFELVVGAISSQLLTDEVIKQSEWIGGVFIVLAALLAARTQSSEATRPATCP